MDTEKLSHIADGVASLSARFDSFLEKRRKDKRGDAGDDYEGYKVFVKIEGEEMKKWEGKYSERDKMQAEAKKAMNDAIKRGKKTGMVAGGSVLPSAVKMYDYKGKSL